jgi:putative hydrolases of HD superfamily
MEKPDIHRLIELQRLLLQFHQIERSVRHPHDFEKRETDTEHSFVLAMAAWMLASYFPELDKNAVIQLALVHDLVEVHAGDTFAYADSKTVAGKADREAAAINKLAADWPDFPDMIKAIRDYEARRTNEAKFVYALDKLMPIILNYLNQGRTWRHDSITLENVKAYKDAKIAKSPEVYVYYEQLLDILRGHPEFFARQAAKP